MVTSLKFTYEKDSFHRELSDDIRKIKSSPNVFVFADKTNNIYEMSKDHHQKLLHDNVTKTYQKAPPKLEASINMEAKSISTKLKISDIARMHCKNTCFCYAPRPQRQLLFQSNVSLNKYIKNQT